MRGAMAILNANVIKFHSKIRYVFLIFFDNAVIIFYQCQFKILCLIMQFSIKCVYGFFPHIFIKHKKSKYSIYCNRQCTNCTAHQIKLLDLVRLMFDMVSMIADSNFPLVITYHLFR